MRRMTISIAVVAIALAAPLQAQDFKLTPAKELASNPQRFWARGVVFRDTLVTVPGKGQKKIADRTAFPFSTKTLGECLADDAIAPVIRDLQPGREYIFTATVYSESRGFWIRKRTVYRYLVDGVVAPIADFGNLTAQAEKALAARAENDPYAKRLQILQTLILRVQESLSVIAASEQLERDELFRPDSEHFEKLVNAARRAVNDIEVETNIPGREHLAQAIVALVALAEYRLHAPVDEAASPDKSDPIAKPKPVTPATPVILEPAVQPEESPVPDDMGPARTAEPTAPTIESVAEPTPKQTEEPLPRRRSRTRATKDEEPPPSPSLRWRIPLAAPVQKGSAAEIVTSPEPQPMPQPSPEPEPTVEAEPASEPVAGTAPLDEPKPPSEAEQVVVEHEVMSEVDVTQLPGDQSADPATQLDQPNEESGAAP